MSKSFSLISIIMLLCALFFASCSEKAETPKQQQGTILLLLGSKIPYWNQIRSGAEAEGLTNNIKVESLYRDEDTVKTTILNALNNIQQYKNLKGIIFAAGDPDIEQVIANIKSKMPTLPLVAVDQKPSENSPVHSIIRTSIVADNIKLGKGVAARVAEKQLVTLCYPIGGSLDRSNAMTSARGKDIIHKIIVPDAKAAATKLKAFMDAHPSDDYAVVFTTGSFINNETMNLLKGKKVYSVDMDSTIEAFIQNGSLEFTAIPNTYEMGARAIQIMLGTEEKLLTQYVSIVYANKHNITTDVVQQFLK